MKEFNAGDFIAKADTHYYNAMHIIFFPEIKKLRDKYGIEDVALYLENENNK